MRIRILGAGIIGLACADELLRRGHQVTVFDPAPGTGASHAAAGMLSPAGELWHGEAELFRLGRESAALWPEYAARLGVPLRRTGTLLAGLDHGDLRVLERQVCLLEAHKVRVEALDRRAVRALEPTLSGRVAGGALLPDDHSVDPRAVVAALLARVPVRRESVPAPKTGDSGGVADHRNAPESPVFWDPGSAGGAGFDATVVATGASLPGPFARLVRRVRGEILRIRTDDPPRRTIRGWAHGEPVYAVPRARIRGVAEVAVGATSEEHEVPAVATVGGIFRLLEAARLLLPGLEHAELSEVIARDRPGTPDNLPLVGPTEHPGVLLAAGHYRHGVLLAPLTARLLADCLESGRVDPAVDPRRFAALLPERTNA